MDPLGQNVDTAVVTGDVIRAEVLWTLKVVMCHYSFNSCNDISATFRAMFPDSGIAKTFTCGATKCAYLSCFGLAPYFHEQLVDMVRSTACYSISFDECMNRISQNKQMDFIIRYWNGNTNKVAVRLPWVWVSRPCHSCRPFDPFQTRDQPTGSQTTTSGVYGRTKC